MIFDYSQQLSEYEQYRNSVPGVPPPLLLASASPVVRQFFSPLDVSVRAIIYKLTVIDPSPWSDDPDDQSEIYYGKRLVFQFNSETSINGFADYSDRGYYVITINAGLYAAMEMIFQRLFTDNFVFPQIGVQEASRSNSTDEATAPIDYSIADLEAFLNGIPYSKDASRRLAAGICAVLATFFTVWHELVHVVRGHIDHQRKVCEPTRLREIGGVDEIEVRRRNRDLTRTLEHEADSIALSAVTRIALSYKPVVSEYGADINAALCTFALTVLFFVFDRERTEVSASLRDLYPHPEIRAFNALSRIQAESAFAMAGAGWQSQFPHASPEKGRELLREAVRQGIVCNHIIGRRAVGLPLMDSADIEVLFPDLSEIRRQLQQLDSALIPLSLKLRDARAWAVDRR